MKMGFYEGVNLSLAYCDDCGHEELEMDVCPVCGSKNLTKIDRMNGYLSYSRVKGDTRLNDAKMAEIKEEKYVAMNYHNITKDDMLNGDGLRVVLWVAGCSHGCLGCQNPITWDVNGGLPFTEAEKAEIFEELVQRLYFWYYIQRRRSASSGKPGGGWSFMEEVKEFYPE